MAGEIELSGQELHDVTVAAIAQNTMEAARLVELLEDADIPVMMRGGIVHWGSCSGNEIVVPRVLVDRAREVIAQFRHDVDEKTIADAFTPENVTDALTDKKRSPEMDQLYKLVFLPAYDRESVLKELVTEWLADDVNEIEILKLLAVAGCTVDEGQALLHKVKMDESDALCEKLKLHAEKWRLTAWITGLVTVIFVILALMEAGKASRTLKTFGLVPLTFVISVCMAARYRAKIAVLTRVPRETEDGVDRKAVIHP